MDMSTKHASKHMPYIGIPNFFRRLETGDWRLETGDWRLETVGLLWLLFHWSFFIPGTAFIVPILQIP